MHHVRPAALALALTLLLPGCAASSATSVGSTPPASASTAPPAVVDPPPPRTDPPAAASKAPEPEPPPSLRVDADGPLTPAQLAVLHGSPQDEVPERRNGILRKHEDEHYVSGNERTLDVFHRTIADVGGGYIGVGTDQGYLLIDWARPDVAWLIDYDAEVLVVHELYRRFFLGADTPEAFLRLWTRDGRDDAMALLRADTEPAQARTLVAAWDAYHEEIRRRLGKLATRMERKEIPCYLLDPERYAHLRGMIEHGRVRPMLANLLDDDAIVGIAEAARQLEVQIRVLYLSNAEQYWKRYAEQYRSNIAALPLHEDAVVLRTQLRGSIDKDFHYGIQPATNYVQWLQAPYVRNVYDVTGRPEAPKGTVSVFRTEGDPAQSWVGRRWRAAQERTAAAESRDRAPG